MKVFTSYLLATVFLSACASVADTNYVHLKKAEEYTRLNEPDNAVLEYKEHIESRLEDTDRPDWENPYFYYLIIGDIYLGNNQPERALVSYERAGEQDVAKELVYDRYRLTAKWYVDSGDLDTALAVLKKYRNLDPLMFDMMLDRVSKQIVAREDQALFPTAGSKTASSEISSPNM